MAPKQPIAGPSRPKPSTSTPPPPPPAVSGFNASRTHFALALPVLGSADKVQIWDVPHDRVSVEWEVQGASKVSALVWASVSSTSTNSSSAKKRRKRKSGVENGGTGEDDVLLVATEKAELFILSLKGELIRTISLPHKATSGWSDDISTILATSGNTLLILSPDLSSIQHTYSLPISPSAVALLSTSTPEQLHVIVASSSVVVLHLSLASPTPLYTSSPLPVSTSAVTTLTPLPLTQQGSSFLVVSEDDRTVSQYTFPSSKAQAKLSYRYASPTLSPAHSVAISLASDLLSVLHVSGEISLFPIPREVDLARPKTDSKPSTVKLVEGKEDVLNRLCRVGFVYVGEEEARGAPGALWCGRMVGGARVKWYRVVYELPEGGVKPSTIVKCEGQDLVANTFQTTTPLQRYITPTNVQMEADNEDEPAAALPTDIDMADLSLGERLLALPNGAPKLSVRESAAALTSLPSPEGPVNAASLTRLLVQALHTSDPALLTLCLSHRDPVLIRNTVRKMPAQMALPLLKACVERLGQGKGVNRRGGGRGNVQNEQQGRGTVEWVKGVLVERGAILMTMPSLPVQLAQLSKLLQARMEMHQPLLALSGRLDLALAQISARRAAAEMAATDNTKGDGVRYMEGESEDEDEDEDGVEIERDEGDGEVEDVDMAFGSEDDDDDDEEEDEGEDEDEDEDDEDEDEDEDEDDEDEFDDDDDDDDDDVLDIGGESEQEDDESEDDDDE